MAALYVCLSGQLRLYTFVCPVSGGSKRFRVQSLRLITFVCAVMEAIYFVCPVIEVLYLVCPVMEALYYVYTATEAQFFVPKATEALVCPVFFVQWAESLYVRVYSLFFMSTASGGSILCVPSHWVPIRCVSSQLRLYYVCVLIQKMIHTFACTVGGGFILLCVLLKEAHIRLRVQSVEAPIRFCVQSL